MKKREKKNPSKSEAEQPAEAAVKGPLRIPIAPKESIASLVPLAMAAPKPIRGTEAPEPANSNRGEYKPKAPKSTPKTT